MPLRANRFAHWSDKDIRSMADALDAGSAAMRRAGASPVRFGRDTAIALVEEASRRGIRLPFAFGRGDAEPNEWLAQWGRKNPLD